MAKMILPRLLKTSRPALCPAFCIALCIGALWPAADAQAQQSRAYIAGYMGLNLPSNRDFSESSAPVSGSFKNKNALSFAGALGLRLDHNWRVEGEISYRKNDIDRMNFSGGGTSKTGGSMATTLFMANLYYDFDLEWENLFPFVTAGIGVARHNVDIIGTGAAPSRSDTALGFAYQVGSGMRYKLSDDVSLTGSYNYVGTTDLDIGSYNMDYSSHEIRFGIQYNLPARTFRK